MDIRKAIFVLWEYFDLLQKEGEDLREQLDALETLVVCHVEETKPDENQCPKTMAAIGNLENILLARAKRMEELHPKREEIMSAMQEVLTDLRCRAPGTDRDGAPPILASRRWPVTPIS